MTCEHCWSTAKALGIDYSETTVRAEKESWPCTKNDLVGAKLRAGDFWDEARMCDRRAPCNATSASQEGR